MLLWQEVVSVRSFWLMRPTEHAGRYGRHCSEIQGQCMHYLGNTLSLNYPVIAQPHMNRTEREAGGSGIARGY